MPPFTTRLAALAAVLLLSLLALPAAASAAPCPPEPISQPFAPWLDVAHYKLAPGGDFESGAAGWGLRGGTAVVDGNEPFHVSGAEDARSLRIPAGGSASSPATCVEVLDPTLRFFARGPGSLLAVLSVDVVFADDLGVIDTLPVGVVTGLGGWRPTLPMPVLKNLMAVVHGSITASFRFRAVGGAFVIDDVYVDPYRKG